MIRLLSLKTQIRRYAKMFQAQFAEGFSLDASQTLMVGGSTLPVLNYGKTQLTLNHSVSDRFADSTGVTTTVFIKSGDDFIRVSTSIKNQRGERAVGTYLDRAHPGYASLKADQSYVGLASVFGAQLMTQYDPIKDAAGKVIGAIVVGLDITRRRYAGLSAKLTAIVMTPVALAFFVYACATEYASTSLTTLPYRTPIIAVPLLLVLGALLYLFIRRYISMPLTQARAAAEKISSGDLSALLHVDRRDELGDMLHAINGISQGLARLVGDVRQGTDQITLASQEIATGNMDLSSRTEAQASVLAATAGSSEDLAKMVRQNAGHAMDVNQHASAAGGVAEKGGQLVAQVVHTMSMIKQSSRRIADVISVVDDIAFQTNLLALNAAVEAARAGAGGRGFAVVATEVRGLAQRSAEAAKEIKTLVETSVVNVGEGEVLVLDAGRTMTEIIASVKRVTDVILEMNGAGQIQSEGIEQVNNAVRQMDGITQQNAALVEEAAAAAQSMHDQALALSAAVSVFKLA